MKVWVLVIQHPNMVDVLGVYDSMDKAMNERKKLINHSNNLIRNLVISEQIIF